jgi:Bacterial regulatory helix-turn-helix protein, lysR family
MRWSDRVGRRLKLRDLHIVLAVAESGSMAKAAADLAISQPVATIDKSYSIGIIALKNRTLAPFAQVFIDHALKIAKSMSGP